MVFWLYTAGLRTQIPPKHIQAPLISMNTTQIPPDNPQISHRHPPDISREHNMPTDANRCQQTLPDTSGHWQVLFEYVWRCQLASVVVCLHVVLPGDVLGVFVGCLGGVWGYLSGIHGNRRRLDMFRGYLGSQSCSMEPKLHFGTTLKGTTFFHLTIPRHQNTKTAAYKLSKNDWVRPFFGIFRFAREKLFVTVAFDHPVPCLQLRVGEEQLCTTHKLLCSRQTWHIVR